jgi:hypothetical protein
MFLVNPARISALTDPSSAASRFIVNSIPPFNGTDGLNHTRVSFAQRERRVLPLVGNIFRLDKWFFCDVLFILDLPLVVLNSRGLTRAAAEDRLFSLA